MRFSLLPTLLVDMLLHLPFIEWKYGQIGEERFNFFFNILSQADYIQH